MRKSLLSLIVLFFVLGVVGWVSAISGPTGNARKGKYLFRKNCRVCHQEGAAGEMAGKVLNPDSKTQAQWKRIFEGGKYKRFRCKDEWEKLSDKNLTDIYTHLYKHAFDSPSPAKCK